MRRLTKIFDHVVGPSSASRGATIEPEESFGQRLKKLKWRMFRYAEAARWSFDQGRIARARRALMGSRRYRKDRFRYTYKNKMWGTDGKSRFFSGVGSRGLAADIYVDQMAVLLNSLAAELGRRLIVVDLGCGDFCIGAALIAKVPKSFYIGCDIVPELIAHNTQMYRSERVDFRVLDIVTDVLPKGDVYLVRQVLQHLSNADVMNFLQRARCEYVFVTEGQPQERMGTVNPDVVSGAYTRFDWSSGRGRGLELDQPPFSLKTKELFRAVAYKEVIITERVFLREC